MKYPRSKEGFLNDPIILAAEAFLSRRFGFDDDEILAQYGKAAVAKADGFSDATLEDAALLCANLERNAPNYQHASREARVTAAFSTVTLPGLLSNLAGKRMLRAYREQPPVAVRLCAENDVPNFQPNTRHRLAFESDLEPVAPDGGLKHATAHEETATVQVETFGKTLTVTREMIVNDDLGAIRQAAEAMGHRARRKIDTLFFERLLDNDGLFAKRLGNYADGPATALSSESLAQAIAMFQEQTDAEGIPLNLEPKYLLVPPSLKMAARELVKSTTLAVVTVGGDGVPTSRRIPTYNAIADEDLEVVSSAYLSNPKHPKASAKGWYLFGDPKMGAGFEITYLRGVREPQLAVGNVDADHLGLRFSVLFDVNVTPVDHRGMVFFRGE